MSDGEAINHVVSDIRKNRKGEIIRVSLSEYQGKRLVDVRVCFVADGEQKYQPTKKGCGLRVDQIDDLIASLSKAKARAREVGWIP